MANIKGDDKANRLGGTRRNDTISGGKGNDTITGGAGIDKLTGGDGRDVFIFDKRGFGLDTITDFKRGDRIDLSKLHIQDFGTVRSQFLDSPNGAVLAFGWDGKFEQITFQGRTSASLKASDFIFDTATKDLKLKGTAQNDILFAARGDDSLNAGAGDDRVFGGGGDDTIDGGVGNDQIILGDGKDRVVISTYDFGRDQVFSFTNGDKIDLSKIGISDFSMLRPFLYQTQTGDALLLFTPENRIDLRGFAVGEIDARDFVFARSGRAVDETGSLFGDIMIGSGKGDRLNGLAGLDTISGGAGRDTIEGGASTDRLAGGAGADRFVYRLTNDAFPGGSQSETIVDFSRRDGDRVDLAAIDANADFNSPENDTFTFIGSDAFSGAGGELRFEVINGSAHVYGRTSASALLQAQFEVILYGVVDVAAADFIL